MGFDRHGGSAEPPVATSAINHDRTGNALAFESVQQPAVTAVIAEDRFDPAVFRQPAKMKVELVKLAALTVLPSSSNW